MSLRQSQSPYGYQKLLVYRKAEELQQECVRFTATFPREKTLIALADQMDRSARSVKQNIVEGWKRNSTREYYDFLGFSLGANAELEEDCNDLINEVYEEKGLKGIMGEKGQTLTEVERLRFYPLDTHLPLLIQLKLRGKELNLLLEKLQASLAEKMVDEGRLAPADQLAGRRKRRGAEDQWFAKQLEEQNLVRLPNGQIVTRDGKTE